MGEICPKTKSYPPLIKQKLILTPAPHIMIILRLTPPSPAVGKRYPPIDSLIPSLLFGFLPPVQTSLQMTLRRMSKSHLKSHQNHWTLSLCRLRMNWEIPYLLQHLWHWGSRVHGWDFRNSCLIELLFLKLNLIILCFIYHIVNWYGC